VPYPHRILGNALIGLELTFHSPDSKRYVTNTGFPLVDKANAISWWNNTKKNWARLVEHSSLGIDTIDSKAAVPGKPQKDLGGGTGDQKTLLFTYLREGEVRGPFFWWELSLDPGVVEVRTMPVPAKEFMNEASEISQIIDEHIFEPARKLNFTRGGDDAGGGHLNVDFATGFDSNHPLVVKVVLEAENLAWNLRPAAGRLNLTAEELADLYENPPTGPDIESLKDTFSDLIDFGHSDADPFLSSGRFTPKKQPSGEWDKGLQIPDLKNLYDPAIKYLREAVTRSQMNAQAWEGFTASHADWLHAHPTGYQYNQAVLEGNTDGIPAKLADADDINRTLHYQAVNVSHVSNPNPAESRVEFRFFKGQTNTDDIRNGLRVIALHCRRAEAR
jgi:hypothetical protein